MLTLPGLRVERLGEADIPALQALYERCRDFVELAYGAPPRPDEAAHLLEPPVLPKGTSAGERFILGLFEESLVGVLDMLRDYPERGEWFIGLLMLDPAHRGCGLGSRVQQALEPWARSQGAVGLRLIVQEQNPGALRFWQRQGYSFLCSLPQKARARDNIVSLLRKPLTALHKD